MARFSAEDRDTIRDMREAGVPVKRIAKHPDWQNSSLRKFIADHGGPGQRRVSALSSPFPGGARGDFLDWPPVS